MSPVRHRPTVREIRGLKCEKAELASAPPPWATTIGGNMFFRLDVGGHSFMARRK